MVDTTVTFDGRYFSSGDLPAIRVFDNGDSSYSMGMHSPAIGTTSDTRETDADASTTTMIALLRGCLQELQEIKAELVSGTLDVSIL